jgi:hypothetical protein
MYSVYDGSSTLTGGTGSNAPVCASLLTGQFWKGGGAGRPELRGASSSQ